MEPTELEINSFVMKFKQLWKLGFAAPLDMDTFNGKAWMGLRIQLGDAPVPKMRSCGNKERRRSRRAEEAHNRKTQTENKESDIFENSEEVTDIVNSDAKEEIDRNSSAVNLMEDCKSTFHVDLITDLDAQSSREFTEATEQVVHVTEPPVSQEEEDIDIFPKNENIITSPSEESVSLVHATVSFQNSKSCLLDRNYVSSLTQIIQAKEHLRQNIYDMKFGYAKSFKTMDSSFEHEVPVIFHVKTDRLLQNARSYLCKYLGQSVWSLQDDVKVTIKRIHQK